MQRQHPLDRRTHTVMCSSWLGSVDLIGVSSTGWPGRGLRSFQAICGMADRADGMDRAGIRC